MNKILWFLMLSNVLTVNGQWGAFSFPSLRPPNFGFDFPNDQQFPSMSFDFGFDEMRKSISSIKEKIEASMKPMKMKMDKSTILNGRGGVTIMQTFGKSLIIRDDVAYECNGELIQRKPFCLGFIQKFVIRNTRDFCYSHQYLQNGDMMCIANSEQTGLSFTNKNGRYSCYANDNAPAFVISLGKYKQLCNRLPWEVTYYYYPDLSNPMHMHLPNPEFHCYNSNVCVYKPEPSLGLTGDFPDLP